MWDLCMDEAPARLGNEPGIRPAPVMQQHMNRIWILQHCMVLLARMFAATRKQARAELDTGDLTA